MPRSRNKRRNGMRKPMPQFDSTPRQMRCCGNCDAFAPNGNTKRVGPITLHLGECHDGPPFGFPAMMQASLVMAGQGAGPQAGIGGGWPPTHHASWCRKWKLNPHVQVHVADSGDDHGLAGQREERQRGSGDASSENANGERGSEGNASPSGIIRP
jgi:hypothetical protein